MSEVGALIISLRAETAQFREEMGKVKGQLNDLQGTAGATDKSFNMMEAKGSMMLLGEEVGVRLPRHLQTLIAKIPGVGAAFSAMLPIVGVVAAIAIISKVVEKIEEAKEKISGFGQAWAGATATAVDKTGQLDMEILKLRDSTAKLYGKPAQNGLAIAAIEALVKINGLDAGILKAIGNMEKLMKEQNIGVFDSLLTGKGGTSDIADALKPKMDAAKAAFVEVVNAESQLELDTVNKVSKEKLAADAADIASKKVAAKAALDAVQQETRAQQNLIDAQIESATVAKTIHTEYGDITPKITQSVEEAKKQHSLQSEMLAGVKQQTTALQLQLGMETALTTAMKDNVAAQGYKDDTAKQADLLKNSEIIMKAFNANIKLAESYDQLQAHIREVNFKLLADDAEAASKSEEKMLKSGEALTRSLQTVAKAQTEVASAKTTEALTAQAEGYQHLADQGLMTQTELAKKLIPIYQAETAAKLAAVQEELNREIALEKSQRASGEGALANETLSREITLQNKLYQIRQAGDMKQAQLDKQRYQDFARTCTQETTAFNDAIAKQIVMGGNLAQSMRMIGATMLQDVIKYAMQETLVKVEQWGIQKVMKLLFGSSSAAATMASNKAEGTSAAGLAGANMMASFALAPWPIDMGAPAAAAAAMATAMGMAAFEQGGKIPGQGAVPILGHGGETVVTRALTDRVEQAEGKSSASRGELHLHANFAPHIHAIDADGVDSMLKKHGTVFQRHITSVMRKMNRAA